MPYHGWLRGRSTNALLDRSTMTSPPRFTSSSHASGATLMARSWPRNRNMYGSCDLPAFPSDAIFSHWSDSAATRHRCGLVARTDAWPRPATPSSPNSCPASCGSDAEKVLRTQAYESGGECSAGCPEARQLRRSRHPVRPAPCRSGTSNCSPPSSPVNIGRRRPSAPELQLGQPRPAQAPFATACCDRSVPRVPAKGRGRSSGCRQARGGDCASARLQD